MSPSVKSVEARIKWTDEQVSVIEAPASARQLVEAGPGTGKTAVACARVAYLIDQGVNASTILMFSFTRTAVAELRNRIRGFSRNPEVAAVRIATLDSQAWYFRYGTGADFESLTKGFDENILETIRLLDSGNDVLDEYLRETSHLIVDEAQDLTSARGQMVAKLIEKVSRHCGVTVFADPCQGIYGFTNDYDYESSTNGTFLSTFPFEQSGFTKRSLTKLHRTSDPDVAAAFNAVRSVVSTLCQQPLKVVETIQKYSTKLEDKISECLDEHCLVLYRRRAQALLDAQYYPYYCRLRLSGLPVCIHPWIGAVLAKFTQNTIQLDEFIELWESTVDIDSLLHNKIASHEAWNLLHDHAAAKYGGINLVRLRELLERGKPHADFLIPDCGMWGPIFSTIHGSKGREAENVVLMLPRNDNTLTIPNDAPNAAIRNCEESRVYYVGATRAKGCLEYDIAKSLIGATSLSSGRVWHSYERGHGKQAKARVQFGLNGDLDETALVRRDFCESEEDATQRFDNLLALHRSYVNAEHDCPPPIDLQLETLTLEDGKEWRYRLQQPEAAESDLPLGWLTPLVGRDLFEIANEMKKRIHSNGLRPPTKINGYSKDDDYFPALKMLGLRTVVVPADESEGLHEPFRSSRFLIVPVIAGFPSLMFQYERRSSR